MEISAAHALIRFGLGRGAGQPLPADPNGWLRQQLNGPDTAPPLLQPGTGGSVADALSLFQLDRTDPVPEGQPRRTGLLFRGEAQALFDHAISTEASFRERLVWFWANHFTVSTRRGEVGALAGSFVREAIRPHVTGRFQDMLLAVMRHPAMLLYLDNAQSVGPSSPAGLRQKRGLNENLARECLELHTLTPASGYTQADVTEFARILTGWSIEQKEPPLGFKFRPFVHDPGPKTLMGFTFQEGEQGGVQALSWLAQHPGTHRALAQKLARHFIADQPPPDAVRVIEGALRDTRGDLRAAALAAASVPAAWTPLSKLRSPLDLVLAAIRGSGLPPGPPNDDNPKRVNVAGILQGLGQGPFNAPQPDGWPDRAAGWAAPEAMLRRVDWAYGFAGRSALPEPVQYADTVLGPLLTEPTSTEIRRAGSRRDGIALLLASPEFQRR